MPTLPPIPDDWLAPPDLGAAAAVQRVLAAKVRASGGPAPVRTVAGVDVSQFPRDPSGRVFAAVVVLDAATLRPLETATAMCIAPIPYIPGFLGFREVPALLAAFAALSDWPDLIVVDGHGISHPRGLGIAAHLGVLLDRPTIGSAKSILVGHPESELGERRGATVPLVWKGAPIGTVLRTRQGVAPVYVSPGHAVGPEAACAHVLRLAPRWRLPAPIRAAHDAANRFRKAWAAENAAAENAAAGQDAAQTG